MDQSKIDRGKLYLQDKAKFNLKRQSKFITDSRNGSRAWCFNESNMDALELIKITLSYKFKGFRYTFEDLQEFFIDRTNPVIEES